MTCQLPSSIGKSTVLYAWLTVCCGSVVDDGPLPSGIGKLVSFVVQNGWDWMASVSEPSHLPSEVQV